MTSAQKLNLPFGTNQVINFTYSKIENDNSYIIDITDNTFSDPSDLAHIVLNYDASNSTKYINQMMIQTPAYDNYSNNLENITTFGFKTYTSGTNKSQIIKITAPDNKFISYDYSDHGYIKDITDKYGNTKHLDYVEQEYEEGVDHIHQDGDKYHHNVAFSNYVVSKETNTSSDNFVYLSKTYDIAHNGVNFAGPDLHDFDVEHNYLVFPSENDDSYYQVEEMPIISYWMDLLFRTDSADTEDNSYHTVASEIATQTFTNTITSQSADSQTTIKTEETYDALSRKINLKQYLVFPSSETILVKNIDYSYDVNINDIGPISDYTKKINYYYDLPIYYNKPSEVNITEYSIPALLNQLPNDISFTSKPITNTILTSVRN